MTPMAQLRAVLKRIKRDAERVRRELYKQGDACRRISQEQKYYEAANRLECLLVEVNGELDELCVRRKAH